MDATMLLQLNRQVLVGSRGWDQWPLIMLERVLLVLNRPWIHFVVATDLARVA